MAATVDSSYQQQDMYSQGGLPMNYGQHPQAGQFDGNVYGNQYYGGQMQQNQYNGGQMQPGGDYSNYGYQMAGMNQRGNVPMYTDGMNENMNYENAMNNEGSPHSFIMPKGGVNPSQNDASFQAYQNAMGGNFCFYDTAQNGGGSMMPQGFVNGYEQMMNAEAKTAVKKLPAKKESNAGKKPKAKTLFPCC